MWYGCYYAMRQYLQPGKGDIDTHRLSVTCTESDTAAQQAFTNHTGAAVDFDTQIRTPDGSSLLGVTRDDASGCQTIAYTHDPATGRVHVAGPLALGPSAVTTIAAHYGLRGDLNRDGQLAPDDIPAFIGVLLGLDSDCIHRLIADVDGNAAIDGRDVPANVNAVLD